METLTKLSTEVRSLSRCSQDRDDETGLEYALATSVGTAPSDRMKKRDDTSCLLCQRVPVSNLGECVYFHIGTRFHRFNKNNPHRKSACGKAVRP